jgi:hypothetical protein
MLSNLHALLTCVAITATGTCISGCRGRGLLPPAGSMNQQQASAVVHDPYPENDIAPYEAASRPPSYQQPLPEPVRNRIVPDAMPWLGR